MCVHAQLFSCVPLFETPWTVAHHAPLLMAFSKEEYWNFHFLFQGIFPTQGLNPCLLCLLHWQTDSLLLSHLGSPVDSFTKWPICTACKNVLMAIFLYAWLMWWLGQQWWLPSVDLLPADLQKAGPARVVLMNPSTELRGGSGITLHCREKKPTDQWYCCCCC